MAIDTALVVDDSRSARYILQRLLERQHIHVDGVDSAAEALAYLREVRPDVVFMDDMMPGMDGQEAVERMAANPATANIPIVMYTANDYISDSPQPQRRGIVGVLSKPFAARDVEAVLAKLGGTVVPPPITARLVRQPASMPTQPEALPTSTMATSPLPDDLAQRVAMAVATETQALHAQVIDLVKMEARLAVEQIVGELLEEQVRTQIEHHESSWRRALDGLSNEQGKFQERLLEQRVPRLLEILEQRLKRRIDVLQKALSERIETSGLGPLQRTQATHIARTTAAEAAQRPARESARRVAAELMRTDISALNLRLDRLRRRFDNVAVAAVIAALAAGLVGYLVGAMG